MNTLPRDLHAARKGTLETLPHNKCFVAVSHSWEKHRAVLLVLRPGKVEAPGGSFKGDSGSPSAKERGLALPLSQEMGCSA